MARPFSIDRRECVVDAVVREVLSCRGAAVRFGVGESTAIAWVARFRQTGGVAPGQMGGRRPRKLSGAWRDWQLERCQKRDFTLRGLVAELAERGMSVEDRVVWEFVQAEGLMHKTKTLIAAERERPDVACRRAQRTKSQGRVDPARLVFIDETWTKTNMAPLRGWAPRGQRLKSSMPHGHGKTMTLLAALCRDRVQAPWLLDGPIDGESFRLYVEKVLVPTLRMGDIVIMDNLGSHKSRAVRQAIRAASAGSSSCPSTPPT